MKRTKKEEETGLMEGRNGGQRVKDNRKRTEEREKPVPGVGTEEGRKEVGGLEER